MKNIIFAMRLLACLSLITTTVAADESAFLVRQDVAAVLERYCHVCHAKGIVNGEVRLDHLENLALDARLDLLNRVQEQVFFGEMPPKDEAQPTEVERDRLAAWVSAELRRHNASKLEDKLRMPEFGNVVNHDQLFTGKYKDLPGYTPYRRWLVSEFIFDAKINKLLDFVGRRDIDGKRYEVIGDNGRNGVRVNLTNPFLLPTHSGVRYYDTAVLDSGHLQTMLTNAKELSAYFVALTKKKNYLPAITAIMAPQWEHEKTLAARESYLNANIEPLLRVLHPEAHEPLLPAFIASQPASVRFKNESAPKRRRERTVKNREVQVEWRVGDGYPSQKPRPRDSW